MKLCFANRMRWSSLLVALIVGWLVGWLVAYPALVNAQTRTWQRVFPANTLVAEMTKPVDGYTTLGGNKVAVSVACQIRDVNNLLIVPSMMPAKATVRYQLNVQGELWRVWLLAANERPTPYMLPKLIQ